MRQTLEKQFKNGKVNLLIALALTVLNMVMILTESNYSFPFSVFFPQFVVALLKEFSFGSAGNIIAIAGIALILGAYFAFGLLADKHYNFLIGALVLFSIDTVLLVISAFLSGEMMIVDILFHLWVLFYLIIGVRAGIKLSKLPPEPVIAQTTSGETSFCGTAQSVDASETGVVSTETNVWENAKPLRSESNKGRVWLEADYNGMHIKIKRIVGLTELVVNGYVYGEEKGMMVFPFFREVCVLDTVIGFELKMTGGQNRFAIKVNGREIAAKTRII